jgi:hypothetical protein
MAMTVADIVKASLVLKAQSGTKVEGESDGPLNWSLTSGSLIGGDSITGSLDRDAGEVAGQYAINKGTLDAGTNYDLAFVAGTYEVTAAGTPPVVTPPVVTPPVTPPVVVVPPKPPVISEPSTPTVNVGLEQAKEIIASISVTTKASSNTDHPATVSGNSATNPLGDYRLINLGMKLPDDMALDESSTN